jgi:UDP-glucose:(heptosyl)LPS alpha-1,3-glucosyltransferase
MRIAMVGRYYNRQGGVSAVIAELSDRAGIEHSVDIYTSEALDTDGSPARFIHVPMLERPPWLQVPTFAWRLRSVLDASRYDIVHVHDAQGLQADVVTYHSCGTAWFDVARREVGFPKSLLSRIYPPHVSSTTWERFALNRLDASIITVSSRTAEELTRYHGIDPGRIHVIHNGIDTARFSPPPSRAAARAQVRDVAALRRADAVVFLFAGYSFRRKGLAQVLHAMASVADDRVELWVVGGDDPAPYRRLAGELGLGGRVRFLGHRSNVVGLMQAADAFVMPSSYDPFPLVLLEALSCGTPVITSRAAGMSELMTDGREGYIVEDPFDTGELARALGLFLEREAQWPEMSSAGRALALDWDWDSIWRRTEAVYAETLARKRDRARMHNLTNTPRT